MKKVLFAFFGILLAILVAFVLMVILWIACNALSIWSKSTVGVFLAAIIAPLSVFVSAALIYRLAFKTPPFIKHKIIGLVYGVPLFLLGAIGSFLFPAMVDAALKKVAFGVSAVTEYWLGIAGVALVFGSIVLAYSRQRKK